MAGASGTGGAGAMGGAPSAQFYGQAIGGIGSAGLDMAGNILEGQSRADQQINDYKNWRYMDQAMLVQQAHEKAMLQDQQARQGATAQVGVGSSGMSLSSSNAMASLDNMFRAQSQEQRNQSVNQNLQQRQSQQQLNNMNAAYRNKSISSYVKPFSQAFSSLAGDSKSTSDFLGTPEGKNSWVGSSFGVK